MFRLNKTITKLSLVSNKAITNIGIKTLLEIKHNNQHKLTELKISPNFNDNSEFRLISEIDIFNENFVNAYLKKTKAQNIEDEIENKNLQPLINFYELERPGIKNGNKLVNNFFISDDEGGINIIECLGVYSKEIGSIQTILNSYIYWQILELAEKVRFSVVIRDNSANDIVDSTYKQFTNIFRGSKGKLTPEIKNELENALSYIISVADYKTVEEKNANIALIDEQKRKIFDIFASFKDKEDALSNSASDANLSTTIEAISKSKNEEEKNINITVIDEQKHANLDAFASSTKGKGDALLNSGSDANPLITEE
ncbi:hypothetical protein [Rickettsia helvetica]|uniref:Uncharacterized protein n=1 Tax=Rickettsia helvetica TaxID=35789 RepID=A0ABM9NBX2_RICHE|nr:hypothetical protein [Rickettsia helvetica]MCZ6884040.1 hypothetical protein [Rickettsia endosymbiont of Ixodes ricinus]MCZ6896518.1 hypothetical protein [Rickettsia endosymbiont of Ixodes ricinus]